jgi:hypothetical protein
MKWFIIICIILALSNSPSTYCDGFTAGYTQGYCYENNGCVTPVTPVCPVPKAGQNEYKDGYNVGFSQGRADND